MESGGAGGKERQKRCQREEKGKRKGVEIRDQKDGRTLKKPGGGAGDTGARCEEGGGTHVPERVQVVVGELQLLEGDQLPHPVRPGSRRVRMHVESAWHGGLGLASHRPR